MIISISAKCNDLVFFRAEDIEREGDLPDIVSIGQGDYIRLEIDSETGHILNWKPFTKEQLIESLDQ